MSDEPCHWNGEQRVTARHLRDCEAAGCDGCEPCQRNHCAMPRCSRHTEDNRCGKCVGDVRDNLRRIRDLCSLAPIAAVEGGFTSAAVDLAGPVAEQSTHAARWYWAVHRGGLCQCLACPDLEPIGEGPACLKCNHHTCRRARYEPTCPGLVAWLDNADDDRHPLWVLGSWDMLTAEHLGHTRRNRVTVPSAAAYLASNLTDLARHHDYAFEELAREIDECRLHVEQVLLVAEYVQRGAPCPACRASGRKPKQLERAYKPGTDDTRDLWTCPTSACRQTWTIDEYAKFVYVEFLDNADRLTAAQIQAQYRVPTGTVRGWASLGKVRKRGANAQGHALYDVSDTLRMRDGTTQETA